MTSSVRILIFDLDAGDGTGWEFVVETTLSLRDLLAAEGFACWPKLTVARASIS